MIQPTFTKKHPKDSLIRADRLPHIWCPACGLGEVANCFIKAVQQFGQPIDDHIVVSGIGCTGRMAGYINLDSYHTTHGRPIAFATGMKLANPKLQVSVISGDGDLTTIGGNHLIHAARRNININVIMVNNFNFGMTGGQFGGTTPVGAKTTTTPYGNYEQAFNMPYLMKSLGAPYVARWTTLHVRQLENSIEKAFDIDGFSFIEIISACHRGFGRKNRFRESIDQMKYFEEMSYLDNDVDITIAHMKMKPEENLIVGEFENEVKPSYHKIKQRILKTALGETK